MGLPEDLKARGHHALDELVAEGREETLHLEFRRVAEPGAGSLSRDDRRRIARAVCGMANADGGTLIIGVASRKVNGLDVAHAVVPMAKAAALRDRLTSALPDMLGPRHAKFAVVFLAVGPSPDAGVLVVEVPPSSLRPHMVHGRTAVLPARRPGHDRDVAGRGARPHTVPARGLTGMTVGARRGTVVGRRTYLIDVVPGLRNVGEVPVRAAYLRLGAAPTAIPQEAVDQGFVARTRGMEGSVYVAGAGMVLHVGDEVYVATVASGIHFGDLGTAPPWDHMAAVGAGRTEERVRLGDFASSDRDRYGSVPEQSFELSATLGAENVRALRPDPRFFCKPELFRLFRSLVRWDDETARPSFDGSVR